MPDVARSYLDLVLACKDAFAAAFRALADEDHAIVFHCVAGKDRTGIVAALLLSVLGVPEPSIMADYHATEGAADRLRAWANANDPDVVADMESTPGWVLRAPATTMEAFLAPVRDSHGSIDEFLAHLGIGRKTIGKLRYRLLE